MKQISGKFYPFQNREWVECCKSLTKSQLSVLYKLALAQALSAEFGIAITFEEIQP